jgi:MFS family permease
MGWAFAAFAWAYALFEIPGGWLGDKIGPRKVLMRVVVWWSFFTAATGWAWNLASLLVTRFFFGAGEAGCFPNLAKMFTNWLPREERSRAVGVMWLSARWGGAFTPLLVVWVFSLMSWRHAFELFGAIGIIWAIFFYRWFRDNPRDHKSVNAAELALLHETQINSAGHAKRAVGEDAALPHGLDALAAILLLFLRLVLLHHLAADLLEGSARAGFAAERAARGLPPVFRRTRFLDWRRRGEPTRRTAR